MNIKKLKSVDSVFGDDTVCLMSLSRAKTIHVKSRWNNLLTTKVHRFILRNDASQKALKSLFL